MAFALSPQRTSPWGVHFFPLIHASPFLPSPPSAHLFTAAWVAQQRSLISMSSMPGSSPRSSSVPWRTAQPTPPPSAPAPPPGPAPPPQPKAKDLVGYTTLMWERARRRMTEKTLGVVTEVIAATESGLGHPLLRVVAPPDPNDGPSAVAAEHLIPLVRSIVPRVDPAARRLLIEPPDGLLDLGHRRALLQRLKAELLTFLDTQGVEISVQGSDKIKGITMPLRRELAAAGRRDLVRLISAAGGFVEVAQELGFEASRRPPGYWEDEEALDRELSLFVAANWVRFEEGPAEKLAAAAFITPDDPFSNGFDPYTEYYDEDSTSSSSSGEEEEVGGGGRSGGGSLRLSGTTLASDPALARDCDVYWYNQVTRKVRWTQPVLPQALELDDQGSLLLTESDEDRAMPSRSALFAAGRFDLHHAIVGAGGYTAVAQTLDRYPAWPPTRHLRSLRALGAELREAAGELGLPRGRMPTRAQLSALGRDDLHLAVMRQGGYPTVAEKLRWKSQRKKRKAWEDLEAVAAEVARFAAAAAGGVAEPRMPTHAELMAAGRHDLRHALQRHGSGTVAEAAGLKARRAGVGRGRRRQQWLESEAAAAREAASTLALLRGTGMNTSAFVVSLALVAILGSMPISANAQEVIPVSPTPPAPTCTWSGLWRISAASAPCSRRYLVHVAPKCANATVTLRHRRKLFDLPFRQKWGLDHSYDRATETATSANIVAVKKDCPVVNLSGPRVAEDPALFLSASKDFKFEIIPVSTADCTEVYLKSVDAPGDNDYLSVPESCKGVYWANQRTRRAIFRISKASELLP